MSLLNSLPIIGKDGKVPQNTEQAQKNQMKHIEEKAKQIITFAIEQNFTADELFLCCDVVIKKFNNTFNEKVDVIKEEWKKISVKDALLPKDN